MGRGVMAEQEDGKQEDKFDFDSAGEALGYISLDQARVLALQHARDNREIYGRYAERPLSWDVISADETVTVIRSAFQRH